MATAKELSVKENLEALAKLQKIHSKIDEINVLKGELPIEVSDLEDEIAGLETRMKKIEAEAENIDNDIKMRKNSISDAKALIVKYEKQQENVKNTREYDALTKEIELNKLDNELHEKKMKELQIIKDSKADVEKDAKTEIENKKKVLKKKKEELSRIIKETEKEETDLEKKATKAEKDLDERILASYNRIRRSYRNGLAVVAVLRNSCGGCFATVPPQRQSEINQSKKIVICEHCGRILVDAEMVE